MKVLYLYLSNDTENKNYWISKHLPKGEYDFDSTPILGASLLRRLIFILFMPVKFQKCDIIVTTEYYLSFFLNIRLLLTRCNVKHIVWGLNQSRRLLVFRLGILNKIVNYIFNRANAVVTHSRREAIIFSNTHAIDYQKFRFVHWGYDLPAFQKTRYVNFDDEYVCMIGRNNRDWQTFAEAVEASGIKVVAVCSSISEHDRSTLLATGIRIYENLSMAECLNVIKYSLANVVLVNDDERGAGHITVVSSMLMAKPQIISNVEVLSDYFTDGVHGYTVPISSPEKVSYAINEIKNNQVLRKKFSVYSQEYAQRWFSPAHIASEFDILAKAVLNQDIDSSYNYGNM